MGPRGFCLSDVQQGVSLALGSDTDEPGGGRCQRLHPSVPPWCCSLPGPRLAASEPELTQPGSCLGASCLVCRQGNRPLQGRGEVLGWVVPNKPWNQGGLSGGGDVYPQCRRMSGSLPDNSGGRGVTVCGGGPEARKRGTRGSERNSTWLEC